VVPPSRVSVGTYRWCRSSRQKGIKVRLDSHVTVKIPSVGTPSADVVVRVANVALAVVAGGAK
jgi:hypothetical protein